MGKKRNKFKIPETFDLGFRTINVWYDPKLIDNDDSPLGTNALGTGDIYLQPPIKDKIDNDEVCRTFCHELIHGILYSMGEAELCVNERHVDGFATYLMQFMISKNGDLLKAWKDDLKKEKKEKKDGS